MPDKERRRLAAAPARRDHQLGAPTRAASTRTTACRCAAPQPDPDQINGHPVSSGDWFVLNQSDNAGRSVSYTLLPSSLVSQVVVHKTSAGQAGRGRHRQRRHHHP